MNLGQSLKVLLLTRAFSGIGYFSLVFLLAILLLESPFLYKGSQISILVGCLALTDRGASLFWSFFFRGKSAVCFHFFRIKETDLEF